jgi:hypothetical protein
MSELGDLEKRLEFISSLITRNKIEKDVNEKTMVRLDLTMEDKRESNETLLKVAELFKSLGGSHEKDLLDKLSKFVNYGLVVVFGGHGIFVPAMSLDGKDIRVDFFIEVEGSLCGIADAKGGGVAEVVSILLQLFFMVVMRGQGVGDVLIMDTALVHLSDQYHERMSALLKELCDKLNIQIILMIHSMAFGKYADKLYLFRQEEGKTIVTEEMSG